MHETGCRPLRSGPGSSRCPDQRPFNSVSPASADMKLASKIEKVSSGYRSSDTQRGANPGFSARRGRDTLAREHLERRLRNRLAGSKLPDLIEFALARPLVSATLVQIRLKVSRLGALNFIGELGLREMTGRGGIGPGVTYSRDLSARRSQKALGAHWHLTST